MMRRTLSRVWLTLVLVVVASSSLVAQDSPATYHWSLWLGSRYTGLDNYTQKVGEYNRGEKEAMPEVGFTLNGAGGYNSFDLQGHFYNPDEADFLARARVDDRLKFSARYRSVAHRQGTDLLENLLVRESTNREGTTPGGKMITHEDLDPGAEYGYTRHQVESNLEYTPRRADWLKLSAAHRSIIDKGDEQLLTAMHCSSCHISSMSVERDQASHAVALGAAAEKENFAVDYKFDYRTFSSGTGPAEIAYDSASHPTTGLSGDEFASRVNYEGEDVLVALIPDVKKMAHQLNGRVTVWDGTLLGRASTMTAENDYSGLKTTVYSGAVKYSKRLSPRVAVHALATGRERESDETPIDLLPWREGRAGGGQDFDYIRYSTLTGRAVESEAELTFRPNAKTDLGFLVGYEAEQHEDYPSYGAKETMNRYVGQFKAGHRPSRQVNARLKYRLELTDNSFTNYNRLLEENGHLTLEQNSATGLAYYYQREALRTGDITTQPTMGHYVDIGLNLRPSPKFSAQFTAKATMEKNDELAGLDNFEYERTAYQPAVSVGFTPQPEWNIFGSFSYLFDEANGPVTVAMMDG
jgi:hypothetical protein